MNPWIWGIILAVVLLGLIWLLVTVRRTWRVGVMVREFVDYHNLEAALAYVERHPLMLKDRALHFLDRWRYFEPAQHSAADKMRLMLYQRLLERCQAEGVAQVRQAIQDADLAPRHVHLDTPHARKALTFMGQAILDKDKPPPQNDTLDLPTLRAIEQVTRLLVAVTEGNVQRQAQRIHARLLGMIAEREREEG